MPIHKTRFALGDTVTAHDTVKGKKHADFTVEAIRIEKRGVSYLLAGEVRDYPEHQTRIWCREEHVLAQKGVGK